MTKSIYWHTSLVNQHDRQLRNAHKSFVLWFTGLSGSGKSTLASAIEKKLFDTNHSVTLLDGDNIRHGLNADLSFSKEDRHENIRRVGEVAKLFTESGVIVLAAFVSPYQNDRDQVRNKLPQGQFFEIFCDCDLSVCEERDSEGQYASARRGEILDFTGVSAPYEKPVKPDLIINSVKLTVAEEVNLVLELLRKNKLISI